MDSCQEQQTAMKVPNSTKSSTNSLPVKLDKITKKQATKASGNGPICKQQMKKHIFNKT